MDSATHVQPDLSPQDPPVGQSASAWWVWALVAALGLVSLGWGMVEARRLVRVEASLGALDPAGRAVAVGPGQVVRATVCAGAGAAGAPEGASLVVRAQRGGAEVGRVALTSYQSMRPRCAAGQWESDAARSVWVRVEGAGGTGATATLRRSGALGGRRALPVLGVLLALGVLALAGPRAAPLGPPEGLLAGRFGLALAFGVFVVSNLVGPIPVVLLGRDAPGLVAGTVAQHGALAVLSAWLLVRGRGGHWRAALGWGALPARTVVQAVATGVGLLAVAGLVTRFIDDPTATPMGQALEEVPVRYALALTALLAPVSEELFFRGLVYRCLEGRGAGRWARWMPVLGQGLLFAGAHAMQLQGALVGLVPILGVGLAAGFWRARTGGLAAPWVVHAVYNGTLVLSVFASA